MKTFKRILSSILVCALIFGIGAIGAFAATVPADPDNLRANKILYKEGEYISIFWDAVEGATDYWVNIYNEENGEKVYSIKNGTETSISIVRDLPPAGDYRLIVLAGNAEGYSKGNNQFCFTVYNAVPKAPENLAPKNTLYSDSENIVITWDLVSAADKYIITLPDGTEVQLGNTKRYTISPMSAGTYEVSVKAGNSLGYGKSSVCSFTVYDTAPEAPQYLKAGKYLYSNYEEARLSWASVSNATEYSYSLSKDGETVDSGKTEETNRIFAPLTPGNYMFSVKSVNAIGESESVSVEFTVYLEEYTLSYDLDGGTGDFADHTGSKTYTVHAETPVKDGYEFCGWINPDSPADITYNPGDSITISEDTTLLAVWKEIPLPPAPEPEPVKPASISFKKSTPSSFNYGDIIIMHVTVTNQPENTKIVWETTGSGVKISASQDGTSCTVTSTGSGTATITAKLVDSNGNTVKNEDNSEVSVSKEIKSNAGFLQKIISFFKNLFSLNRIIAQSLFY